MRGASGHTGAPGRTSIGRSAGSVRSLHDRWRSSAMTYHHHARTTAAAGARPLAGGLQASAATGAANAAAATQESASHTPGRAAFRQADTSLLVPEASATGTRSTSTACRVRADALRMLGCVRMATVRQMAQVITAEGSDGRSYVRRAMQQLKVQGLAETNGKHGRNSIWNLAPSGLRALAEGNEL
ncbi:replication-relaxation family protein, partial [Streptomyces rimosus]